MFTLEIGAIVQEYDELDSAIVDCFEIYPDADFSDWQEDTKASWMTIYENNDRKNIIGKIIELPSVP